MSLSFNLSLPTVRESSKTKCTTPEIVYKELEALRTAAARFIAHAPTL